MGADKWSQCPRCREAADQKAAQLRRDIDTARATGDFTLFEALLVKSNNPPKITYTLRQDWEIGFSDYGWKGFLFEFAASCDVCGFKYSVKALDETIQQVLTITPRDEMECPVNVKL